MAVPALKDTHPMDHNPEFDLDTDSHSDDRLSESEDAPEEAVDAAYARLDKALGSMERVFLHMKKTMQQQEKDMLTYTDRQPANDSSSHLEELEQELSEAQKHIATLRDTHQDVLKRVDNSISLIESVLAIKQ